MTTVSEVQYSLTGLLGRYAEAPGVGSSSSTSRRFPGFYVQFICYGDGALLAEAVSNEYLPEHLWRNEAQEETLAHLGWRQPSPPEFPNWVTVHSTVDPPVQELATRTIRTLRQVFGLGSDSSIIVKVFTSALRRDGPLREPDEPRVVVSALCDEEAVAS